MALLKANNLAKRFGGVTAVDDFSIEVDNEQIVGIIGPNGAGKTTIFNLLSKVYTPDTGAIFLDGKEVTGLTQMQIAVEGISRTFQNIRLFSGLNVLENVKVACDYKPRYSIIESILMLPRRFKGEAKISEEAMECLKLVGLDHLAYEKPGNLPYGLQRRLEIARALAMKPKVLMLDEPAAGLNPEEVFGLVDFIRKIKSKLKISLIIIEHRMDLILELCDKIYVQDFGRTIAVGTPDEIQVNPAVLNAYLGEEEE
jgi:ABC-type branched-subunit amino acid transport system ATPase component